MISVGWFLLSLAAFAMLLIAFAFEIAVRSIERPRGRTRRSLWRIKCPACDGEGGHMQAFGPYPGSWEPVDCGWCHGEGRATRQRIRQCRLAQEAEDQQLEEWAAEADRERRLEECK